MSRLLLTLPRTALCRAGFVPDACHVALLAPSQSERARAMRALRGAVMSGRIPAAEVARAVRAGDGGVAGLFRAHAVTARRPRVPTQALDLRDLEAAPPPFVRAGLARLIETLVGDGDLTPEALATVPKLSMRDLAVCLNGAWERRVIRVTRGLRSMLPGNRQPVSTHYVYPAALHALIHPGARQELEQSGDPAGVDAVIGLNQVAVCWVGSEADSREDRRALGVAWNEMVRSLGAGTLNPWRSAEDCGYLSFALEGLHDLALSCGWDGGEPRVDHEALAQVAEEMGEDPHDADLHAQMRDYMREVRADRTEPTWSRRSKAFQTWRAAKAGTPISDTVECWLAIARWRSKRVFKERLSLSTDCDEGMFAVTPVHRAASFGERLAYFIGEDQQQVGDAQLSVARQSGSSLSLGQVLDALIADAAVASAAWSATPGD